MVPICTIKCKPFRDPLDSIEDIHSTRCVQRLGDQSHNTWNNHSKYAGSKNAERWYIMCTGNSIKKPCALPKANGFLICYIQIYLCWGLTICDWNSEHSPSIWSKVWKWWSAGLAAARLWMRRICQDCHMAATELPWLKTRWISFCFQAKDAKALPDGPGSRLSKRWSTLFRRFLRWKRPRPVLFARMTLAAMPESTREEAGRKLNKKFERNLCSSVALQGPWRCGPGATGPGSFGGETPRHFWAASTTSASSEELQKRLPGIRKDIRTCCLAGLSDFHGKSCHSAMTWVAKRCKERNPLQTAFDAFVVRAVSGLLTSARSQACTFQTSNFCPPLVLSQKPLILLFSFFMYLLYPMLGPSFSAFGRSPEFLLFIVPFV